MTTVLTSDPRDGIRLLTLNRPDRLNTVTEELIDELHAALDAANSDPVVRVVVITGAGRGFSGGLDLAGYGPDRSDEMGKIRAGLRTQRHIATVMEKIRDLTKPVIAAVNGPAAGAGLAIVLASDIRIAAPEAVFAVSFIRAGFSACDMGTSWLLPRIVGAGRAHELMLTGRRVDADEALRIGLVLDIHPQGQLLDAAFAKADEVMLNPPFSVELTKQGMWIALETPSFHDSVEFENRQQILSALTEDRAEATAAFLEKRPPKYRNR